MNTDYRKLCLELFGTDDVEQLRAIAGKTKNARHAGRKRKFSESDVADMLALRRSGMPMQEIAERYGTSRQMVGKYLTAEKDPATTMRMTYMCKNIPCTVIDVDFLNSSVKIVNYTDDLLHRAFGIIENPSWEDFMYFLEDRCVPRTRGNIKQILSGLGIDSYDPLQIIEKTQGRLSDDDMWLKIRYFPRG